MDETPPDEPDSLSVAIEAFFLDRILPGVEKVATTEARKSVKTYVEQAEAAGRALATQASESIAQVEKQATAWHDLLTSQTNALNSAVTSARAQVEHSRNQIEMTRGSTQALDALKGQLETLHSDHLAVHGTLLAQAGRLETAGVDSQARVQAAETVAVAATATRKQAEQAIGDLRAEIDVLLAHVREAAQTLLGPRVQPGALPEPVKPPPESVAQAEQPPAEAPPAVEATTDANSGEGGSSAVEITTASRTVRALAITAQLIPIGHTGRAIAARRGHAWSATHYYRIASQLVRVRLDPVVLHLDADQITGQQTVAAPVGTKSSPLYVLAVLGRALRRHWPSIVAIALALAACAGCYVETGTVRAMKAQRDQARQRLSPPRPWPGIATQYRDDLDCQAECETLEQAWTPDRGVTITQAVMRSYAAAAGCRPPLDIPLSAEWDAATEAAYKNPCFLRFHPAQPEKPDRLNDAELRHFAQTLLAEIDRYRR